MFDFKKLKKYRGRDAVSPVVATLILIIVAIVGAVAVGLIVSGIGTSTGKQANANGAGSNTQSIIYVGGSTTVYPVTVAAIPAFESENPGITISLAQGGSDAGMQGLLTGAYDVGEASSANAVNNLFTAIANNNIVGVTPDAVLIGGSGVVFATTSTCLDAASPYTAACTAASPLAANPLFDGTTPCLEISRAALAQMYVDGEFYITAGGCTGNALVSPTDVTLAGPGSGPFAAISRSDPGGTEDTACGYLSGAGVTGVEVKLSYTGGSGVCGGSKNIGSGNLGVLQATQACSGTATGIPTVQGCIGFFDIGFAEGKSAQAAATCPSAAGSHPCNVFITQTTTTDGVTTVAAPDTLQECTSATVSTSFDCYSGPADSTATIETEIKAALKTEGTINVQTLQLAQAASLNKFFPDASASTAGNPLDRTFYYVTNGAPTATVQKFMLFMTSYNAEQYFTGAGYYSQYDFTSA